MPWVVLSPKPCHISPSMNASAPRHSRTPANKSSVIVSLVLPVLFRLCAPEYLAEKPGALCTMSVFWRCQFQVGIEASLEGPAGGVSSAATLKVTSSPNTQVKLVINDNEWKSSKLIGTASERARYANARVNCLTLRATGCDISGLHDWPDVVGCNEIRPGYHSPGPKVSFVSSRGEGPSPKAGVSISSTPFWSARTTPLRRCGTYQGRPTGSIQLVNK